MKCELLIDLTNLEYMLAITLFPSSASQPSKVLYASMERLLEGLLLGLDSEFSNLELL